VREGGRRATDAMEWVYRTSLLVLLTISLAAAEIRYGVTAIESPVDTNMLLTVANDISENGFITGYGQSTADSPWRGAHAVFLYHPSFGYTNLGALPGYNSLSRSVNNSGQIAVTVVSPARDGVFRWNFASASGDSFYQDLGTLGAAAGEHAVAHINNAGQVVGWSENVEGDLHAFRYTDGVGMKDLGTLGGFHSRAYDINEAGWVVGISRTTNQTHHAFVFRDDRGLIDLGPGSAAAINNRGIIAGGDDAYNVLLFVEESSGYRRVPIRHLGGYNGVGSINDSNVIVGGTYLPVTRREFAWVATEAEGVVDLNDLIDPAAGWRLLYATAINNSGQIVGAGVYDGREMAFRLDPNPRLTISLSGLDVVVAWPSVSTGFVLQQSSTLQPDDWNDVNESAYDDGRMRTVKFPSAIGSRLFRLRK
jgi:probable HAF family extracellular repeat protein